MLKKIKSEIVANPLLMRMTQEALLVEPSSGGLFEACVNRVIESEYLEEILSKSDTPTAESDFWSGDGCRYTASLRPYNVKDGVLQIPVIGALMNRFPFQMGRWATGYEYIEKAMERGLGDSNVLGIALVIDSGGGEVAGNFELSDKIFESRGKKPIRAFAADYAYSAAYSIASAADSITVPRSGGVGSIGVVNAHFSYEGELKKRGIKFTPIYAGKHKLEGSPYQDMSKQTIERIQKRIDKLYGVFTKIVARNRGMTEKEIRGTEALTYDQEESIDIGLADTKGIFEEEIFLFSETVSKSGEKTMSNTSKETDIMLAQDKVSSMVDAARATGVMSGATEERKRISGIIGSKNAIGREVTSLALALETEMTVEQANIVLGKLPKEVANEAVEIPSPSADVKKPVGKEKNHFEEAMSTSGNPDVGAGTGGGKVDEEVSDSATILKDFASASEMDTKKNELLLQPILI